MSVPVRKAIEILNVLLSNKVPKCLDGNAASQKFDSAIVDARYLAFSISELKLKLATFSEMLKVSHER